MAYYEFPHTRNYDQDLGYLISMYKELDKKYESISKSITEYINKLIIEGKLFVATEYNETTETLKIIVRGDV